MDVALTLLSADRVEALLLGGRPESDHGDDLSLAAGENRRAVRARQVACLDPDWANLRRLTAVGTDALIEDVEANLFLEDALKGVHDLFREVGSALLVARGRHVRDQLFAQVRGPFQTQHLVGVVDRRSETVA